MFLYFSLFGCFVLMAAVAIIIGVQKLFQHPSEAPSATLDANADLLGKVLT